MEFFEEAGKMAIGSRLRMLTETITEDAQQIYALHKVDLQPKWFPVFYVLSNGEQKTITGIAKEIGHSHPSVSNIIQEMVKKGLVKEKKDPADGRRTLVSLSLKGKTYTERIKDQYTDVNAAIEEISAQANHDLWRAIGEWEFLLKQKSLLERVKAHQKLRESQQVRIVPYEKQYATAFRELNEAWISEYFTIEPTDRAMLENAEANILGNGGYIFVALYKGEVAGVCALVKMDDPVYKYELAKMAVSPAFQGKNIGYLLGKAVLDKAKALGAKQVYLESNTVLKPAISLYHKLGFQKVTGHETPYARCNIQMAVSL